MDQETMVGAQIWHKAQLNLTLTREEAKGGGRREGRQVNDGLGNQRVWSVKNEFWLHIETP